MTAVWGFSKEVFLQTQTVKKKKKKNLFKQAKKIAQNYYEGPDCENREGTEQKGCTEIWSNQGQVRY